MSYNRKTKRQGRAVDNLDLELGDEEDIIIVEDNIVGIEKIKNKKEVLK